MRIIKREGKFVDPYLYDIIFNVVKPEIKTKVTRSGYTLDGHLRAIEEYVQTDEFFANQENVFSRSHLSSSYRNHKTESTCFVNNYTYSNRPTQK